jgi:hypothetical protein
VERAPFWGILRFIALLWPAAWLLVGGGRGRQRRLCCFAALLLRAVLSWRRPHIRVHVVYGQQAQFGRGNRDGAMLPRLPA